MRRSYRDTTLALAVAAVVLMATAAAGVAADDGTTLRVLYPTGGRLIFTANPDGSPAGVDVTVELEGATPGSVTIALADAVASPSGGWDSAASGSTPYSLASVTTVDPSAIAYTPTGAKQSHKVHLVARIASTDAPRAGILNITFTPDADPNTPGLSVLQAVAVAAGIMSVPDPATPASALPSITTKLTAAGMDITRQPGWTFVDSIIPDLFPALVDHGPVQVTAHVRNDGNATIDTLATYTFETVGPGALLFGASDGGTRFLHLEDRPYALLPDQVGKSTVSSSVPIDKAQYSLDGPGLDTLPFIGLVRVTATTKGAIAGLTAEPVTQSMVILVFPWKELLALIGLIVLLGLLRGGFRRWRAGRRVKAAEKRALAKERSALAQEKRSLAAADDADADAQAWKDAEAAAWTDAKARTAETGREPAHDEITDAGAGGPEPPPAAAG